MVSARPTKRIRCSALPREALKRFKVTKRGGFNTAKTPVILRLASDMSDN